jgi:aldehyde dehydrogenase (NAD+)
MDEEIFGPIIPIINYNIKEEVVDFVRKFSKPLAYYVFSEDQQTIDYYLRHSTSGVVCINDAMMQAFESKLPFGGINSSGMGSYHGIYGFRELSHRRGVFYQSSKTPLDEFGVPPYADKTDLVWQQLSKENK